MPRVVHFEIHANDPERAARFYSELFGWEIQKWGGNADYWVIRTGPDGQPGINGGLLRRRGGQSGDAVIAYVCSIDVSSVDQYTKRATELGATLAVPKMAVPGVCWLAYCKDPDGNLFGMTQFDSNAK